jgi:hypothetical protein
MTAPENPAYRVMDTNTDARDAIARVIASATQEIMIFDRTPITLRERDVGRPEPIEQMRTLLLGGKFRKIRIALQEVQGLETELPRLVSLLGQFGGQVLVHRVTGAARQVQDVLILADRHSVWRKPVYSHPRSVMNLADEVSVKPYVERFEEVWSESELAVADRQSGL